MRGWIEVHGFTDGNRIFVNLANVTSITDDGWIYVVKENTIVDNMEDDSNIHVRESYEEIKALIGDMQKRKLVDNNCSLGEALSILKEIHQEFEDLLREEEDG